MSDSNFWNNIYSTKSDTEVSWFQEHPQKSLQLITELKLPYSSSIIDVGGGNSRLVDDLIEQGYSNLTLLDISSVALDKSRARLKEKAHKVHFIASDVLLLKSNKKFDLWHDRAAFHFLINQEQIAKYIEIAHASLNSGGHLIVSTFSKTGPQKCSGLPITQYSAEDLSSLFGPRFKCMKSFEEVHTTPWGSKQAFVYCVFRKEY